MTTADFVRRPDGENAGRSTDRYDVIVVVGAEPDGKADTHVDRVEVDAGRVRSIRQTCPASDTT